MSPACQLMCDAMGSRFGTLMLQRLKSGCAGAQLTSVYVVRPTGRRLPSVGHTCTGGSPDSAALQLTGPVCEGPSSN